MFSKWLPVFHVLALCLGTQSLRPEMLPDHPEIHINEGEDLKLTCMSSEKIDFFFPKSNTYLKTSQESLEMENLGNKQRVVFRRPNTVYGDTGWYGCAVEGVEVNPRDDDVTSRNYDNPNVKWTYVYVKSNSSFFAQEIEEVPILRTSVGAKSKTIPCRPTSPDYQVLVNGNEIETSNKSSYDPRFGFILHDLEVKDSGYYMCSIIIGDTPQDVISHLVVSSNSELSDLTIINDTLRHVTRGQILRVNCTTQVHENDPYKLFWITPQNSSRITKRPPTNKSETQGKLTVTYELIINGVTNEDEGEYTCAIKTLDRSKKVTTFIKVHDPGVKWINLTLESNDEIYKNVGDPMVQWVVSVDAYPEAKFTWLSPDGDVIRGSWADRNYSKYAINTSPTSTTLRINEIRLSDMGLYSLQASNEAEIKTVNITLKVLAKPTLTFDSLKGFFMPQTKNMITGEVEAYPMPDIRCTFVEAPDYPSLKNCKFVPLEVTTSNVTASLFTFFTSVVAPMSGLVNCTACNSLGCDTVVEQLLVSDVSYGFGVIEPSTVLTFGDDVRVTCAASIYNVTGVEWFKDDDEPLEESERVTITKDMTQFSYRAHLHIKHVRNNDNGSYYTCRGTSKNGDPFVQRYILEIYEPEAPVIVETNMNTTELVVDLSTQGHRTVVFTCYAKGTPSPNVTWYKDKTRIKCNQQYMCLHKNQSLHIKYLLDGDSGNYTCEAVNRIGKDSKYKIIVVKGKEIPKVFIISIVFLVAICVILVIYFSIKMHREKVMRKELMEAGLTHFEEGALECLNPDLTVDDQAELLPYQQKWEFPRERLDIGKQLGSGAFGVVVKAKARGICDDEPVTTVAVKKVKHGTEATYIRALVSELKIMVHLGKHLNVVNLLGACTKNIAKRELLVIVEYCRFGNLQAYLRRHRNDFINQIDPATGKIDPSLGFDILARTTSVGSNNSVSANSSNSNTGPDQVLYTAGTNRQSISFSPDGCVLSNNSTQPGWRSNYSGDYKDQNLKPICTQDLLSWAFQVARGMEYLCQRRVLHGDLAARNILLAENNIVKICDFGLAKTMYNDDNYKKKGDAPLPIKWMAIESIRDRLFSTQSDIWSFGIVLWEFFTLAETPYPGMEAEKQYQKLVEGYRMEKPDYATDEVYEIMLQCWNVKPNLRPTFTKLVASIGDLLEESVKEHYVDLNAPYLDMNTRVLEGGKNDYLAMMSAPDYNALSSPISHYVNSPSLSPGGPHDDAYLAMSPSSPESESGIFSPGVTSRDGKFVFPINDNKLNVNSDSESEAVEHSPMLSQNEDGYLKPLKFVERRAEFARHRQAMKNAPKIEKDNSVDSGYCNIPQNFDPADDRNATNEVDGMKRTEEKNSTSDSTKGYVPSIIRTQDNYVNMPKQKNNLRIDAPVSFSNPSYVITGNRQLEQTGI